MQRIKESKSQRKRNGNNKQIIMSKIVIYTDSKEERKRACVNCGHRRINDLDHCDIDGHYISYVNTFEGWCKRWCQSHEGCYSNNDHKKRKE